MTVDERVHAALVDLADEVRPAPDPYGRLRARLRRVRRRRAGLAGAGLALIALVAATLPLLPSREDPAVVERPRDIHQWAEELRHSPVRGAVGTTDPAFVELFGALVYERVQVGAYGSIAPVSEVNVLYVDDIGSTRVAFVAFHRRTPNPVSRWENGGAWFVARNGASVSELADPRATAGIGDALQPFETRANPSGPGNTAAGVVLGLAPAGCVVESAPLPDLDVWTPEPTGSFVVRTTATERAEWWRVVCAGTVKELRPAETSRWSGMGRPTDAELDAALVGARGQIDRDLARDELGATWDISNRSTGPTKVIWGGRLAGVLDGADGRAVVLATPFVGGGWQLRVNLLHTKLGPESPNNTGFFTWTPANPADTGAVLPLSLSAGFAKLVIAPDGAKSVRAVRDGVTIDTAEVTASAAVVDGPDAGRVTFEALDGDGKVIAAAKLPTASPPQTDYSTW
ncbi:hypothetical protein SAMN05421812_101632 [Asanoa hainanensis]|uniref:Uncharacterized protein n=1 Tax=Asanoa hainanensis TaxID=560556 RepID=A0A239GZS4_9ACTN|nr:hypothetical protein [Asanoa hainanensis]SNS74640.1 hypothetical protein SAMN05421812_101632 [Asanoa hainanensis]